jgi:TnpA family transposase
MLLRAIAILRKLNAPSTQTTLAASLNNLGHLMLEIGALPCSAMRAFYARARSRVLGALRNACSPATVA